MRGKKIIISIGMVMIVSFVIIGCGTKSLDIEYDSGAPSLDLSLKHATLKVFIENSGSMDGYMCEGSEFKDAVKDYVSSLEHRFDTLELYYINSEIIPRPNELKRFITDLTPGSFKSAGGNRKDTDMGELIKIISESTTDSVVSVFVSDCILDIRGKVATDYFTDMQIDVRNVMGKFMEDGNYSVEVVQLESRFQGNYYGLDGVSKLDGIRPYYMWILGRNDLLAQMNQIFPFEKIKHGVKNWVSFIKKHSVPFDITNEYGLEPKNIHAKRGEYEISINTDLRSLLKSEESLADASNYLPEDAKKIKVKQIKQITDKGSKDLYSHTISLSIEDNISSGTETINFIDANKMPGWVEASNDDSGTNIKGNMDKTTGIKYLIGGVAEAYQNEKSLGEITFKIRNK